MWNFNDSQRESYDVWWQNMELLSGSVSNTTWTISDTEKESYDETIPVAKKRIII